MGQCQLNGFCKAYRKTRSWQCPAWVAAYRALRYAAFGDTGIFPTHKGQRRSRMRRERASD